MQKLQRLQNAAARLITGTKKFDHITPVLSNLHWLPIEHRVIFKVVLFTYKALHGLAPDYLANLLTFINLSAPSVPLGPSICLSQDLEPPPMATDPLRVYLLGFGTNFLIL